MQAANDVLDEVLSKQIDTYSAEAATHEALLKATNKTTTTNVLLVIVGGLILLLGLSFVIIRSLVRPLTACIALWRRTSLAAT